MVTAALAPDLLALPWRTCGQPALAGARRASATDGTCWCGMMATAEVAALVAEAHNASLSVYPGASDANRVIRARLASVEHEDSPAA